MLNTILLCKEMSCCRHYYFVISTMYKDGDFDNDYYYYYFDCKGCISEGKLKQTRYAPYTSI